VTVGMAIALVRRRGRASKPGLCSLNKAEQKVELKSTGAITKAIESENWTAAKKALLASFGKASQAEQLAVSALSGAPSNVKAAGCGHDQVRREREDDHSEVQQRNPVRDLREAATQSPQGGQRRDSQPVAWLPHIRAPADDRPNSKAPLASPLCSLTHSPVAFVAREQWSTFASGRPTGRTA